MGKWGAHFQGQSYPFAVTGISVGDVGMSTISAIGNVYNLRRPSDLPGNYVAAAAALAVANGVGGVTMQNQKGVLINLNTVQQGVQLTIGPQGFNIDMR